ncbi:MAG: iron ABC transporter permease [Candidatus Lokiarchaeota archaeon]|nr:iron ABC transporter permease [Candidatus Lokiarchaeota archaeon]
MKKQKLFSEQHRFKNKSESSKNLPISLKIDRFFSKPIYRKGLDTSTIIFFLLVIVGPVLYIFFSIFLNIPSINEDVFNDELIGDLQWTIILKSLFNSFSIAGLAVCIGILLAFPISIILTRYNFRGKKILDSLIDLPLAVPTGSLGISVLLFWGIFDISPGYNLLLFGHIVFTFPYIVRNMKIVLEKADTLYDDAARTLGAPGFTIFRTITLPLMKEGIIAGAILGFTRSLGETGASIILSGLIDTVPIVIVGFRKQLAIPAASFLAGIMITISILLLFSVKFFTRKVGFPIKKVWPKIEKKLSNLNLRRIRNYLAIFGVVILILIPSFYMLSQLQLFKIGEDMFGKDNKWAFLYVAIMNSIQIAGLAVLITLIFGIPFAFIITRRKWGRAITFLDTILDIPVAIPSAALGFSIFMFWGPQGIGFFSPGFFMILFVHITFTFPYMVRPIIGVLERTNRGVEEAARTLGASSFTVFRKITLPNIKQGIIAGGIMVFTRSLGETGATIVVMGGIRTIPVLIVDWVEASAMSSAIFASFIAVIIGAFLIIILRIIK